MKKRYLDWDDYPKRKDKDGNWLCRWCKKICTGRRTAFCGGKCVHEMKIRSSASYIRYWVSRRDKGICAICGERKYWEADHIIPVAEGGGQCGLDGFRTLCEDCHRSETAKLRKRLAADKIEVIIYW